MIGRGPERGASQSGVLSSGLPDFLTGSSGHRRNEKGEGRRQREEGSIAMGLPGKRHEGTGDSGGPGEGPVGE